MFPSFSSPNFILLEYELINFISLTRHDHVDKQADWMCRMKISSSEL